MTPVRAVAVPEATEAEMNDVGQKRGLEPSAGPEGEGGGDITRRFIEALSDDTAELLDKIAEENDVPNCDIIDAHIEPEDARNPSGQNLDPEAVIAAKRCEIKNLLDFEAFERVREQLGGSTPAARTLTQTTRESRRFAAGGCCRILRRTSRNTNLRQLRRRRATGSST